MRKLFLVVALMLTAGIVANAQFRFGVKAGMNISNVAADDTDNMVGFSAGILGEFKISKFAVQPEVLYSFQGAKYSGGKFETSYLNIPVMAKYYITDGLSIEAGPQVGFLLSAKEKIDGEDDYDVKDFVNKTDFAINFGASYELSVIPVGFFARYSLGVTDIYKDVDAGENAGKNRVFQVGAFVKF